MSAVQRSSRSRLKTHREGRSPSTAESTIHSSIGRRKASNSQPLDKRKPTAAVEDTQRHTEDSADAAPVLDMDQEGLASPISNASSSSLSELEEATDQVNSNNAMELDSGDVDTEAETERLEPSPQKLRKRASNKMNLDSVNDPSESHVDQDIDGAEEEMPSSGAHNGDVPGAEEPSIASRSGIEIAGKKRKRTNSININGGNNMNGAPAPKRSASSRETSRSVRTLKRMASVDEVAVEDDTPENMSDGTPAVDLDNTHDTALMIETAMDDGSEQELDDQIEDTNPIHERPGSAGDLDEGTGVEGDEDAAEAAARSEDEAAKKKIALDSLKPIENLFAIFRDRLFDERLALLSTELDILKQPNTTHQDYLAMRQCIDARREEKVHLEQVTLGYKLKALETKCIAERSQLHSQYFQTVRETRDAHIERLHEQQCRIKREMRQWNKQESDFQYDFNPKRSLQVIQQQSYNMEVSILSGIARHVGFPAAPQIEGLRQVEIEEDLRHMKVPVPTSNLNRLLANSRAATAAAEEQFLEETPWANPNHPAVQHAVILERQVSAQQPIKPGSYTSPTTPGWLADLHKTPAALSVTTSHGDPPNSILANTVTPSRSPLPNGRHYIQSSPPNRLPGGLSETDQPLPLDESAPNDGRTTTRHGSSAAYPSSATSQIFPTSAARSEQVSEIYENSTFMPRPGTFGTPVAESREGPNTGEVLPVKHEDDHDRFAFAAIPGREPPFGGGALPAGIAMERFGAR